MRKFCKNSIVKLIVMTVSLLVLDLASKYVFYDLGVGKEIDFIHPSFNFGVAWSISLPLIIIIVVSFVVFGLFVMMYFRGYIRLLVAGFLMAGTLGNLIDRLRLGGVRDFIDIQLFNFPIFNIADIFLNTGIILLIIKEIFPWKKRQKV